MGLRLQRLADLWRYLPAFRVVAETEHLRRAAEQLHVSPSALSRTIALAEESVGVPLFHRQGRGIQLTRAGRTLLLAVRTAMRIVDDGLTEATGEVLRGVAKVGVDIRAQGVVSGSLARLRRSHSHLVPRIQTVGAEGIRSLLLQGALDVAFVPAPVVGDDLETVALPAMPGVVLCPPDHPLAGRADVSLDTASEFEFVAPLPGAAGSPDGWPPGVSRQVAFYVDDPAHAVELARNEGLLVAVPAALEVAGLESVDCAIPPTPLHAVRRVSVSPNQDLAGFIIDAVSADLS